MQHASALLSDEVDAYVMWPCAAPKKWLVQMKIYSSAVTILSQVIQLSEEVIVDTVVLGNLEYIDYWMQCEVCINYHADTTAVVFKIYNF